MNVLFDRETDKKQKDSFETFVNTTVCFNRVKDADINIRFCHREGQFIGTITVPDPEDKDRLKKKEEDFGYDSKKSTENKCATLIYFCEFHPEETKELLETLNKVYKEVSRTAK